VLADETGVLRFEIVDDGPGFDPNSRQDGVGLQNMADRVAALGGELRVSSAPGAGTTVAGSIPLASS
jgi:signal transduction histidine kinase